MPTATTYSLHFINRRKGDDRREDEDPCIALPVDLFHRKRRKQIDRRRDRSLQEDYYAYMRTLTAAGSEPANQ